MTEAEYALVREAVGRIGFFSSERPSDLVVSRLGGNTNRNFKVECEGDAYVLRLAGDGSEGFVDRRIEADAARAAARAGVAPAVIAADPDTGLMVREFVPGATMTAPAFAMRHGAAARAGRLLKQLHGSGASFGFRFDLFSMIDEYVALLRQVSFAMPSDLNRVLADADSVRNVLATRPVPLKPCHCDLLPDNFIDDGERMWLVDWEFSGMNDPMWDLAGAAVECALSPAQEKEMLQAYFGGDAGIESLGRIAIYKALCNLLWSLWGFVQCTQKTSTADFRAYAAHRFERCKAFMREPVFARHLTAVAA